MGAADVLRARLRHAEVAHLAGLDQLLHRPGDLLDRDVGVDAVLVEEVDVVGPQPPQRVLDGARGSSPAGCRAAFAAGVAFEVEAELRRDHDLLAHRLERLPDEILVRVRPVHLRRVEERHAALDGLPRRTEIDSSRVGNGGKLWLIPMQPRPIAETSRPCPSVRFFITRA